MEDYTNATERWLPVPGYEGEYEVSDQGRVRSFVSGKILKPFVSGRLPDEEGRREGRYFYVELGPREDGERYVSPVHRLVARVFLGEPQPGQVVRHGKGGRWNNSVENLSWGTSSENSYDTVEAGNHLQANKTHCKHNHEFTPENTYIPADGGRRCRQCDRDRQSARAKRKKK